MKKGALKGLSLLLLLLLAVAFTGCGEADGKKEVAEKIVGEWKLVSEKEYITKYIFWEGGNISEETTLFDEDGNEVNISMSDLVDLHYEVVDENTIKVYGTAFGYDGRTEAEEIHLEFIDNDTMKLDSDTFAKVKPQG